MIGALRALCAVPSSAFYLWDLRVLVRSGHTVCAVQSLHVEWTQPDNVLHLTLPSDERTKHKAASELLNFCEATSLSCIQFLAGTPNVCILQK